MEIQIKDNFKVVDINEVEPNYWNPNEQTDFIFEKEKASFEKFGMLDPITVRKVLGKYQIIDGEHRWKAAKHFNMEKVIINDLGEVSDSEAQQLTIILNETKGSYNYQKMSDLMKQLSNSISLETLQTVMPFTEVELKSMVASTEVDWNNIQAASTPPDVEIAKDQSQSNNAGDGKESFYIRMPNEDILALKEQINRFKKILFPDFDASEVSETEIWMAIIYILRGVTDEELQSYRDGQ